MEHEKVINLAIADDHFVVRQGIKDIINSSGEFEVTIEANDGQELIEQLHKTDQLPDICILDINMPNLNGFETLKELKKQWPSLPVLVLSAFYEEYSVLEMMRNGANGYLEKKGNPRKLLHALAYIYYNGYYYSESMAKRIFDLRQHNSQVLPHITDREMEFLSHCCSELSYKEISGCMGVSVRTIETFRDSLFAKFNISTRTGLVLFAIKNGIVRLEREEKK
jgi:two-component system invasion response regulator UvrY